MESSEVAISKQQAQFGFLFKLQTTKDFNKEAFKATCVNLWHSSQGVTIKESDKISFLLFLVQRNISQLYLIKVPGPFDKRLIMMKRFHGDSSPANITFRHFPFWIRIFNIPIKSMNC